MPTPLRIVYIASCVMSGVGWVVAVAIGRGGPLSSVPWLILPVLAMPFALVLALGFSEDQRWTRPVLVLLPAISAALLAFAGLFSAAAAFAIATVLVALYLYASLGCRTYYDFLRETAVVRVSRRDLVSPDFVPLYLSAVGATGAGTAAYLLVRGSSRTFSDLGANDAMAAICATILAGVVAGVLFKWLGEKWLARHDGAA